MLDSYFILSIDNCKLVSYAIKYDEINEDRLIELVDSALKDIETSIYNNYIANITLRISSWEKSAFVKRKIFEIIIKKAQGPDLSGNFILFDEAKKYDFKRLYFNLKLDGRFDQVKL